MVLRQEGREEGLRAFLRCSRRRQGLPRTRTNWARGKTCLTFLAVAGRRCACIPQGDCRARRPLSRSTGKYSEPEAYRARTSGRTQGNCRRPLRSEEHTSELQSLMRLAYAVCYLNKIMNITITYS